MADRMTTDGVLFMSDGAPMAFLLRPSEAFLRLKRLIEGGGGVVVTDASSPLNPVTLVTEEQLEALRADPRAHRRVRLVCRSRFVEDCVEKGERLPLEGYLVSVKAPLAAKKRSSANVEPSKFEMMDDANILYGFLKEMEDSGGALRSSGIEIWRRVQERLGDSWKFSAQSMRIRYLTEIRGMDESYKKALLAMLSVSEEEMSEIQVRHTDEFSFRDEKEEEKNDSENARNSDEERSVDGKTNVEDAESAHEISNEQDELAQSIKDIREIIAILEKWTGKSTETVARALIACTGDPFLAQRYLTGKVHTLEEGVWTPSYDRAITGNEPALSETRELIRSTISQEIINKRLQFLRAPEPEFEKKTTS